MKKLRIFTLALLLPAFVMTACDKGGDPATPETPTPQMRYVSSIGSEDGNGTLFEYDSKNRIVKMSSGNSDPTNENAVTSFTYDDVARTVAIKIEQFHNGVLYVDNQLFKLDANGVAISGEGETTFGSVTFTYTDGYLGKADFSHGDYEHGYTMTWSGGNRTRVVDDNVVEGFEINLTYNTSWVNNPLCNIDMNAFLAQLDNGYTALSLAEMIGLFGKRSKHMISSYTTDESEYNRDTFKATIEYDTDGFVTKITAEDTQGSYFPELPPREETTTYTAMITYR